jgi:ACS family tartrate transporter-like MFS transporter
MNEDLGFTPEVFGFGAGILFVGYILFEVPSNLALHRFGARIRIARIMISWGLVATAMGFVAGETSFYLLRFAFGVAGAGFFPGIILYLTYWFPRESRARIVALFMTAVPIATVVGGPLSGALLGLHGWGGVAGWRWLFLIEGIPAVLLGIAVLMFLTDEPKDAQWLTPKRRPRSSGGSRPKLKTRANGYAGIGPGAHQSARDRARTSLFRPGGRPLRHRLLMPQVLKTFDLSNLEIGLLTAMPYLIAAIGMVTAGRNSDATGERIWHVALPLFVSGAASDGGVEGGERFTAALLFLVGALAMAGALALHFGESERRRRRNAGAS